MNDRWQVTNIHRILSIGDIIGRSAHTKLDIFIHIANLAEWADLGLPNVIYFAFFRSSHFEIPSCAKIFHIVESKEQSVKGDGAKKRLYE